MKNILITGCNGFLASGILRKIPKKTEITGIDLSTSGKSELIDNYYSLDITELSELEKIKKYLNIDIIIHLAALIDVDYCESNPEDAYKINTLGTENIAKLSKE
ncbi:MAG: sugar nucleotide-binding protein, partial [Candidatus Hodarchaeales archaeon]